MSNTNWIQTDYADKEQLTKTLRGIDTVMSFITPQTDPESQAQKNLIDASSLEAKMREITEAGHEDHEH